MITSSVTMYYSTCITWVAGLYRFCVILYYFLCSLQFELFCLLLATESLTFQVSPAAAKHDQANPDVAPFLNDMECFMHLFLPPGLPSSK